MILHRWASITRLFEKMWCLLSRGPPKHGDTAFLRNVRNCSPCGAESELRRPESRSSFVTPDRECSVRLVAVNMTLVWKKTPAVWKVATKFTNLRQSVFVLDKSSIIPILQDNSNCAFSSLCHCMSLLLISAGW